MEMNFCRRCGTKLTRANESMFVCEQGHKLYINAAPAVGVFFMTDEGQVVMSVRGIKPYKGALDAFGGFIEEHESLEEALIREIQEETGLTPEHYETPEFLSSGTLAYPFGGENRTVLSTVFWSQLKPGAQPVAADDVADIRYVPLDDFDFSAVKTPDIERAIRKLQELFL